MPRPPARRDGSRRREPSGTIDLANPAWKAPPGGRRPGVIMRLSEIGALVRSRRPPPPYGVRRLSGCHSVEDLSDLAHRRLPAAAFGYLDGGGEDEVTLRRNRAAFDQFEIVPRVLRDVSDVDTATTLLGTRLPAPVVLAPIGGPRLLHHEGELAVARAASKAQLPYAVSTLSTVALEDAAAESTGALWFQLYVWGDRQTSAQLIERAKAAGYAALVVTVDCAVRSKRERELHAGLTLPTPALTASAILEATRHPAWWWQFLSTKAITFANLDRRPGSAGTFSSVEHMFDGTLVWDDLAWIREAWDGPLVLKGVLSPDDARAAVDHGVQAVIVSNHGGRQLDHVPASLDALPRVADAVGHQIEVLFDSGVRRGTDVLAALALGAKAVLVGRAYLYGLAAAGEPGVRHALDILVDELRTAMALTGTSTLSELESVVEPAPHNGHSATLAGPA